MMGGLDELDRVWDHLDPDDPIIFRHTVTGVVPVRGNYSSAPVRKMQDYINGGWKSDNVVIDIDFGKGTYTQYLKQHADTFPLLFLDGTGSAIRVKIGRSTVEVKIDTDGSLVLKRKKLMRFLRMTGKMCRICPICFTYNLESSEGCSDCGYKWRAVEPLE